MKAERLNISDLSFFIGEPTVIVSATCISSTKAKLGTTIYKDGSRRYSFGVCFYISTTQTPKVEITNEG